MAWTKDAVTRSPKIVYTPGQGDTNPCVTRIIYDADAVAAKRYTVEMSGVSAANQSLADVEGLLGIS